MNETGHHNKEVIWKISENPGGKDPALDTLPLPCRGTSLHRISRCCFQNTITGKAAREGRLRSSGHCGPESPGRLPLASALHHPHPEGAPGARSLASPLSPIFLSSPGVTSGRLPGSSVFFPWVRVGPQRPEQNPRGSTLRMHLFSKGLHSAYGVQILHPVGGHSKEPKESAGLRAPLSRPAPGLGAPSSRPTPGLGAPPSQPAPGLGAPPSRPAPPAFSQSCVLAALPDDSTPRNLQSPIPRLPSDFHSLITFLQCLLQPS